MATLHVRGFPDTLYRRLTRLAQQERRSLSGEIVVLLKRELSKAVLSQEEVLRSLDRWRFRPSGKSVPSSLELLRVDRRR